MPVPDPLPFARQWVEAWNRRDVEAVLRLYAEDVVFTSPNALRVVPDSGGRVHGKDELRSYWTRALAGNPGLRFTLVGVSAGIDTLVVSYRDQTGRRVDEVLTFREGLVAVGHATRRQEG